MAGSIDTELLEYLDRHFKEVNDSIHDLSEKSSVRFHSVEKRFDKVEAEVHELKADLDHHRDTGNGGSWSRRKTNAVYGTAAASGGGVVAGIVEAVRALL